MEQNQVTTHIIDDDYIREWLVLGPFFPDDLETDLLTDMGGEANINPREGDTITTSDGRRLTWEKYNCKSQVINFDDAIGDYEYASAYAFCILQSEVACDAEIYLQSSARIALWIKGKQLYRFSSHLGLFFDGRALVVSLKAGTNRCLARVNRARRVWSFGLRMVMLHPDSAIISGTVTDENGDPIFDAHIHLEQDGRRIASASSDPSGRYRMNVYPVNAPYDLAATSGSLGVRQSGIQVIEKERRTLNLTLEDSVSVEGSLLMLDNATPHVAIPVQAIHDGEVVAATFSDEAGKYQFVNMRPGLYQVRCQVLGEYVYYRGERESQKAGKPEGWVSSCKPMSLQAERGKTLTGIDFRFAPFKKGTWRSYDTLDGLAYDAVRDMCCDRNGLMWFATEGGGVSCYDGKDFVNFTARDGLAHNIVRSAYADADGTVWFGTEGGVSRYNGREFVNLTAEDGLAHNGVHDIYRDPDGVMWFATWGGVSRYDGREFRNFTTRDGLVDNRVDVIYPDRDGSIWFGTFWGVSRYDGREFVNLTLKDGLVGRWIRAIYRDPDGAIWFGTNWGGVSRYDGEEFVRLTTRDGLVNDAVCSIHQDPDGVMWFATMGGVSRYDGRGMGDCPHFVNFTKNDGLASDCVNVIHRDPDGVMWFATGSVDRDDRGGVSLYNERSFVNFTTKDGLAHNTVDSIHPESDGLMWFATKGGASRYDGKCFANFTIRDGLLSNWVRAIYCDPDGVVWFGTGPGPWGRHGISRYDGRGMGDFPHFVNFTAEDGLTDGWVNAIYRDPDGVMWFATGYWADGGISRYDGEEFASLTTKDELPSNWIRAIYGDPDGVMWFGTQEGLSRYDGRHFVNFTTKDGLANDSVFAIHRDTDGIMWFATWGGVSRYDGREFVNLNVKDGLAHDMAVAIHQEPGGDMWFGTHAGVSRYNGVAWTSLDARDGLAGKIVTSIHQDSDGYLWFATENGITRYRRSIVPPGIRIVSVKINGEYTDPEAIPPIIVGSHVSIEYSAIDFKTVPEKRQYRCCVCETQDPRHKTQDKEKKTRDSLESRVLSPGSSEAYNPPTKETTFDWIPQEPGTYIFQVQAIDRDLNYSEPATLSLTVQPDPVIVSMQTELNHLRREVVEKYHFENIIGHSASIRQVRALMERAIDSGLTALIIGETGTGKELVAKAIHYNSPRKGKPLLARNCGAIPKDLLASDLFGHRKGAFTGATEDKMGLFEAASGGTVLLDEISEMPEDAQIHLLRVLQEREVQRLGEYTSREVDVRIIAMTNRDLAEEVKADRFREDLYHRLNEFPIHIPPLREHSEDIPLLAEHFLHEYSQEQKQELGDFAPEVFDMLQSYTWPGNVRELRNVIRRAAALAEEGRQIQTYHFPPQITHGESLIQEVLSDQMNYTDSVTRFRRRFIEEILRECDGNRSEAARRLGMDRSNLRKLMKNLGIE